nr:DUF4834 family protein [Ulvibacter litoralis]
MTFLKTILIVLLVYYGLKFLLKLTGPYLMRYVTKKAGQKFEQAFGGAQNGTSQPREEGSVIIDKMPSSKTKGTNTVGEYVDYEEID